MYIPILPFSPPFSLQMTSLPLWAQQNDIFELIKALAILLLIVVPAIIKFFAAQAAQNAPRRQAERTLEQHLRETFSAGEQEEVRQRPKQVKKRKRAEAAFESANDRPAHGTPLVRELAPQGEGSRFDVRPGTLDGTLILTPSVEPTVQPTLESMTGIYDAPPGGEQAAQTPLAVDIFQMLTTPGGIRQAVVLGEILKRPEF